MPWLQIGIASTPENAPVISELLTEAGAVAVFFDDAGNESKYQPATEATDFWSRTRVTGMFEDPTDTSTVIDFIGKQLGHSPEYRIETLEDQDWQRSWMDRFQPMQFASRLWVCPSWHTPPDASATNIFIDPGLAFGTGTHESTALCLDWLVGHPPVNAEVIDYGCGSGILAIAALKLGAKKAWATDIDPQALVVARENGQKNRIADELITLKVPSLPDNLQVDLLLANILAEPLVSLAPEFIKRVKPGGQIILAGFLESQLPTVSAAYAPQITFDTYQQQEWVMLAGLKIVQSGLH
ncbi:MAG: 50S ribosomal protein L11 methyltransferase [Gammaproteobacteria bacterium]|nr:MAG: 50S ribosomal protein L11 methyltransferase [Gammaproteobacteria bacterium]